MTDRLETVEILRELRERVVGHPRLMTAAADEITRLRAENARLREAFWGLHAALAPEPSDG